MLPVRTDRAIPKGKLFQVMDVLKELEVGLPIKAGDLIIENISNTNANLIASKSIV